MIGHPELSLAIPSVIIHTVIGAMLFLALAKMTAGALFATPAGVSVERTVVLSSLVACGAAILAAMSHLSYPLGAWLMPVAHLSSSWLSRESLLYFLFTAALIVYAVGLLKGGSPGTWLTLTTAATGALAVAAGAMIYSGIGAVPAWNSPLTVLLFLMASLLLGASVFALSMAVALPRFAGSGPRNTGVEAMRASLVAMPALLVAVLVITGLMMVLLGGKGGAGAASLSAMLGSGVFWARIVVGVALPLPLAIIMLKLAGKNEPAKLFPYALGVFALVLAGEMLARILFYSTAVAVTMGGTGTPY